MNDTSNVVPEVDENKLIAERRGKLALLREQDFGAAAVIGSLAAGAAQVSVR